MFNFRHQIENCSEFRGMKKKKKTVTYRFESLHAGAFDKRFHLDALRVF